MEKLMVSCYIKKLNVIFYLNFDCSYKKITPGQGPEGNTKIHIQ